MSIIMKIQERDQTLKHLTIDEEECCCCVFCTQLGKGMIVLDSEGKVDAKVNPGLINKFFFPNSKSWVARNWTHLHAQN